MGHRDESYPTHFIDGNGKFDMNGMNAFVKNTRLNECGLSYVLVCIMGPQSSGKSTLVNHLFRTKFRVMNAKNGRRQTTRGAWMAKCVDVKPCTIIMDLEGTDGQERGEDDTLFERQASLFALAVSDVILINMWYHDIGREQGASKPLLRIVFKEMIKLNRSTRRRTLMFVIRDTSAETPFEKLKEMLMENVQEIWNSALESLARNEPLLNDCFSVEVEALPHFELQKDKFREQVENLRQRFFNSIEPGGLVGDRKDVDPASLFSVTTEQIWKQIQETKELDIPKNKILVATVYCKNISRENYSRFEANENWCNMKASARAGHVSGFGKGIDSLISASLSQYDKDSIGLQENVRNDERMELQKKLLDLVRPIFLSILDYISMEAEDEYIAKLNEALVKNTNFHAAAKECKAFALEAFRVVCLDATAELADWDTDISREKEKLKSNMSKYTSQKEFQREQEAKIASIEKERNRLMIETEKRKTMLETMEKGKEEYDALAKRIQDMENERTALKEERDQLKKSEEARQEREKLAERRIRARPERGAFGEFVKAASTTWRLLTLDPGVYYKLYREWTKSGEENQPESR